MEANAVLPLDSYGNPNGDFTLQIGENFLRMRQYDPSNYIIELRNYIGAIIDSYTFVRDNVYHLLKLVVNTDDTIEGWMDGTQRVSGTISTGYESRNPLAFGAYNSDSTTIGMEYNVDYLTWYPHSSYEVSFKSLFSPYSQNSVVKNYLAPRRRITPELGLTLADGTVEYVKLGTYYTSNWKVSSDSLTASTSARDILDWLRSQKYTTSLLRENYTLLQLAEDILQSAGLTSSEYNIDTELSSYTIPFAWFEGLSLLGCLR